LNFSTFLHRDANAPTTLSEIRRIHGEIAATGFLGLYAYATQSGAALFDLTFGGNFWADTRSRWLFGIDYGRTHDLPGEFRATRYLRMAPGLMES